jgi:hypothetical protein
MLMRPEYIQLCIDRKACIVVYIATNYHAEDINVWKNKEYIRCAEEVVYTDEATMGELQWFRA